MSVYKPRCCFHTLRARSTQADNTLHKLAPFSTFSLVSFSARRTLAISTCHSPQGDCSFLYYMLLSTGWGVVNLGVSPCSHPWVPAVTQVTRPWASHITFLKLIFLRTKWRQWYRPYRTELADMLWLVPSRHFTKVNSILSQYMSLSWHSSFIPSPFSTYQLLLTFLHLCYWIASSSKNPSWHLLAVRSPSLLWVSVTPGTLFSHHLEVVHAWVSLPCQLCAWIPLILTLCQAHQSP